MAATPCVHFGAWLRRQVDDQGITIAEFAERAEIPRPTLQRWFARQCPKPHGYQLSRLARAMKLSREEIDAKLAEARASAEPATAA